MRRLFPSPVLSIPVPECGHSNSPRIRVHQLHQASLSIPSHYLPSLIWSSHTEVAGTTRTEVEISRLIEKDVGAAVHSVMSDHIALLL